jgi:ribosome-binding ATPase YchF (GTP1/OBG family)
MQRGFIRAETIGWEDFVRLGGYKRARELGLVRSEGREYVVQDGDVLLFRFNV